PAVSPVIRWSAAGLVTVAAFSVPTWACGAVMLPVLIPDAASRWAVAASLGVAVAALAALWGHSFPVGVAGAPAGGPAPAQAAGVVLAGVRYSLPPDTDGFTGRVAELRQIGAAVTSGPGMRVLTITGMPGVGKTALAVRVARLLGERFPDRQLFIDLHAHTPWPEAVPAGAALAGLLAAAGADPRDLPDSTWRRTEMWRNQTAGQRLVLILDNAATSEQVLPLLPGVDGCVVLVTSRRQLADLPGAVPL